MSVYFAQAGAYVKIGHSVDPFHRSTTVTTSGTRPADLPRGADCDLIGWAPGGFWEEGAMQARFIADRVAGEWFYIDPERAHEAIWADPCGIDVQRMSAQAVLAAHAYQGVSRDQIAAAGVPLLASTDPKWLDKLFARQETAA